MTSASWSGRGVKADVFTNKLKFELPRSLQTKSVIMIELIPRYQQGGIDILPGFLVLLSQRAFLIGGSGGWQSWNLVPQRW